MKRTNIYLEDSQLDLLGRVAEEQGTSVACLVRSAVGLWILHHKVKPIPEDEWRRRFDALMKRRRRIAKRLGLTQEKVDKAVALAVREVREARRARRP
jgi:response regulator of citrate/malate metabolism